LEIHGDYSYYEKTRFEILSKLYYSTHAEIHAEACFAWNPWVEWSNTNNPTEVSEETGDSKTPTLNPIPDSPLPGHMGRLYFPTSSEVRLG
jgi:hypothetical protein